MEIDPRSRFSHRAEHYAKYRPGYPAEIVPFLSREIGLAAETVIADIGSGTGLLSRLWLANGNNVYGVEPNLEMRAKAESQLGEYAKFRSVAGCAENTMLPPGSIGMVSAGQAFHWFDPVKARTAFERILKAGSFVIMAWNTRKEEASPFAKAYQEILREHGTNRVSGHHRSQREERLAEFFGPEGYRLATFDNAQVLDFEATRGILLSMSSSPLPGEPGYEPIMARLKRAFDECQKDGCVRFEYTTQLFYGKLS